MSTLVKKSDIAGEDGRTKEGEGQEVPRGLQNRRFCLVRYLLRRKSSRYYIVTTELVRRMNLLAGIN